MTVRSTGDSPVIMLELNELCPPVLDRMMAAGDLPNFKKLHSQSDVHVTWTDDPTLEPWVQWVTLHTGAPEAVHGAKELDEGHLISAKRVWDVAAERGYSSMVFCAMNGRTDRNDVMLVPDPWSMGVKATDPAFSAFHEFVSFYVTEHTNERAKPSRKLTFDFVRFMLSRGLSLSTIMKAVRQLAEEKTAGRDLKWRRAMILDLLLFDVFEHEYHKRRPDFATVFANSTAYLQHRYWRHMEPEAYQVKPSAAEMEAYGDAVEDSYRHMDALVGRAMKLVGPGGRIIFATALSQEANLRYEHIGGKFVYRPIDFQELAAFMDAPEGVTYEPVMTHQTWATCKSEEDAIAFEKALDGLQSNGQTVMEWRRAGNRVMFWCRFISRVDADMTVRGPNGMKDFNTLFNSLGQVNNSQHHRDGCFWVQRLDGKGVVHPEKLPLENATALILETLPGREVRKAA
ncbi:MAG: alkaline phosphatase family protein [Hyphomonadaceae bacterium]